MWFFFILATNDILYCITFIVFNYILSTSKDSSSRQYLNALGIMMKCFAIVCTIMVLVVITMLAVYTIKVWRMLSNLKFVRANEKSMVIKIVFSILTWFGNLIFIAITLQIFPDPSLRSAIHWTTCFMLIYVPLSFLGCLAYMLFSLYFWWLIHLDPNFNEFNKSRKRSIKSEENEK